MTSSEQQKMTDMLSIQAGADFVLCTWNCRLKNTWNISEVICDFINFLKAFYLKILRRKVGLYEQKKES